MPSRIKHRVAVGSDIQDLAKHRSAITTADASPPSANDSWANPGGMRKVMVTADIDFSGGTTPTLDLTPYVKPPNDDAPIGVLLGEQQADLAEGIWTFPVEVEGYDLFMYIDDVTGSPSSFSVTVYVQPV